jgi:hypothetical protein
MGGSPINSDAAHGRTCRLASSASAIAAAVVNPRAFADIVQVRQRDALRELVGQALVGVASGRREWVDDRRARARYWRVSHD